MPDFSHKMLPQQLKELERDGLVVRTLYPEIPPRVEYGLTELGETAFPILEMMYTWEVEQLGVAEENGVDAPDNVNQCC